MKFTSSKMPLPILITALDPCPPQKITFKLWSAEEILIKEEELYV